MRCEQRAASFLRTNGLGVSSISFAGGFTGGCGFSYKDSIADGLQAIHQAEILGADTVIVVGGSRHGHTSRHAQRLVVDGLRAMAASAEQSQIKLSLLPMHEFFSKRWTFLNSLDQALDLLTEVGHPQVGLAFDAYHLGDESGLIDRIPEIAPITGIVQISDRTRAPQSESDRCLPGEGNLPLPELIQAFQKGGFTGYFDIQVWSGRAWQANYTHLIEQCHAAVKDLSRRVAVRTQGH